MSGAIFRSVEFWKSAIVNLPDNSFFELLRIVFGKIKTPFNKQILADDLEAFLLREDIQQTITCYINHNDARIIAAVATLGEPVSSELESFFSGDLSYAELRDLIINLEERFILYRFSEKGLDRLSLNPVLEPVLSSIAADVSLLFPSAAAHSMTANAEKASEARPALSDRVLAALLSFVSELARRMPQARGGVSSRELFFKTEGEIRKRVIDAGNRVFPGLDLKPLIGGLRVLGLFRAEEDSLVPDYRLFSDFGNLAPRERMEYCAAGICCFHASESPADVSPYLLRAQVRGLSAFVHRFLDSLEEGRLYPVETLKRLMNVLERGGADEGRDADPTAFRFGNSSPLRGKTAHSRLIEILEQTGLLISSAAGYRYLSPLAAGGTNSTPGTPLVVMDTPFSCLVYPEISYTDLVNLASALDVREADTVFRFELTRDSAIHAFDRGVSAAAIIDLLKRLSDNRIDETLIWTLKEWEKRYGEVSLRRGLVLSLSAERRYLAGTEPLARLIKETLAPGIYLLDENDEKEAAKSLQKAGVDIVARPGEGASRADDGAAVTRGFFPALYSGGARRCAKSSAAERAAKPPARAEDGETAGRRGKKNEPVLRADVLLENFHSMLEQMRLGKVEHDELTARIDRRLVLCESQLKDASVRYEKLEARGLDYAGKALIAKQAIALRSPVEIVRAGKNRERVSGIPLALDREAGESILVISPLDKDGGDPIRIPLGKIGLLRRIKKSIFESNP
jgi:hypothetical protein